MKSTLYLIARTSVAKATKFKESKAAWAIDCRRGALNSGRGTGDFVVTASRRQVRTPNLKNSAKNAGGTPALHNQIGFPF
jgi:hypothetical protein